jgi:carboxymethylenebutenolidase
MCHSDDSRPPAAPGSTAGEPGRDLVLEAADGNRFAAYAARAAQPTGSGVVVLPDVRGLHAFYRDLVDRLAEIGVDAVAVDYFGRTAGIGDRSDDFVFRPHVDQTTVEGVTADVAAAAEYLRTDEGGAVRSVYTVGFCFGGGHSWRLSADLPGLAGVVGFYGRPALAAQVVDRMQAPLLMLAAGADANIPPAEVEELARAVRAAGGQAELVVYDGAPHSFFDRRFAEHRDACDDAWRRIRGFVGASAG